MFRFKASNVIVKYRYVITMTDVYKFYDQVIKDWSTGKKLKDLYNGKLMLLISPIYKLLSRKDFLVQLQIDVEGKKESLKDLFYRCVTFTKKYKDTYFVYTGKTGFHIYSNYVYYIDKPMPIKQLRQIILSKYDLSVLGGNVDYISSIRDMPTIRIGKRPDTKRIAFPIFDTNFEWFNAKLESNSFINITDMNTLRNFIRTKLIPIHTVRRI